MKKNDEHLDVESAYKMVIGEEDTSIDKPEIELRFSNNLATEFANTVNSFTQVCAKIVEKRNVDKNLYDKFNDLLAKIKNLADAARNSIS